MSTLLVEVDRINQISNLCDTRIQQTLSKGTKSIEKFEVLSEAALRNNKEKQ